MATSRESPTITDYVVTALSPVLIMLMVGSLVFFLVEVLYAGKYSGKLLYTLFFFVLGAVLVARIAIESDASRASLYGLVLGVATYIALLTYVEYPGGGWLASFGWLVNLGLMLLIWWSAHKLTWDCTHIDEKRKGAGRGLLSATGLESDTATSRPPAPRIEPTPRTDRTNATTTKARRGKGKKKKAQPESRLWDWIDRYKKYRTDQQKSGHTPGVWVIYFALAALPLFALGQSLIDPGDDKRRQATFLQMLVYVGSALALLVTTSLLGLRRYLRQRKASIPGAMTASWLGLGALMIAVFLTLGAFLPRPHSEVPWFGITRAGKSDREASRYSISKSTAGKGDGAGGEKTKAGDGTGSAKGGKAGGGRKGEKGSGGKGQEGKGGSGKSGNGKNGKGKDSSKGGKESDSGDTKDGKSEDEQSNSSGQEQEQAEEDANNSDSSRGSRSTSLQLGGALEKILSGLKWIVFAIVACLIVIAVILAVLRYLAPFTQWAQRLLDAIRNWWANLWGGGTRSTRAAVATEVLGPVRPPPFHQFSNPFTDGSADHRDLSDLVAYTFLALDSWAWDRDRGRNPNDTPLEFLTQLGQEFPDLDEVFLNFGRVYARVTYSTAEPPANTLAVLEQTWDGLIHGVAVA